MRRVDHQGRLGHRRFAGNMSHELLHAVPAVQHRIVHIDVNDAGPVLDLLRRHFESARIVACSNELRKLPGTGHVGALSHIGEVVVFQVNADGFQPADGKSSGASGRNRPRLDTVHGRSYRRNVLRRGSAAASDNVEQSLPGHEANPGGHLSRSLVIASHLIRQACIWVADDRERAESGHILQEREQILRPEGAVQSEGQQGIVADRVAEGLDCLTGQCPAAPVAYRYGDDCGERFIPAILLVDGLEGVDGSLGVEGVKAGLYLDEIRPSIYQSPDLLLVCGRHLSETVRPVFRMLHVLGQCQGLRCRTDASGHVNLPSGLVRSPSRDCGALPGHLSSNVGKTVFFLGYAVGTERVGLDDVRPCLDVLAVNVENDVRTGQIKALVVALQFHPALFQCLECRQSLVAAVVSLHRFVEVPFVKSVFLYHRAHRSVKHENVIIEVHFLMRKSPLR